MASTDRPTYAITTVLHRESGRIDTTTVKIRTSDTDYSASSWDDVLRRAQEYLEETDGGWRSQVPRYTVQVQAMTSTEDGTLHATKRLQVCPQCGTFKAPGVRHSHDVRRAPVVGAVVQTRTEARYWPHHLRTGDWEADMHSARRDDPRWVRCEAVLTVRVTAVVEHAEVPAWEYDGYKFDAEPARTEVQYVQQATGDWSMMHGERPEDGEGSCDDVPEWRSMVDGWEVVAG